MHSGSLLHTYKPVHDDIIYYEVDDYDRALCCRQIACCWEHNMCCYTLYTSYSSSKQLNISLQMSSQLLPVAVSDECMPSPSHYWSVSLLPVLPLAVSYADNNKMPTEMHRLKLNSKATRKVAAAPVVHLNEP